MCRKVLAVFPLTSLIFGVLASTFLVWVLSGGGGVQRQIAAGTGDFAVEQPQESPCVDTLIARLDHSELFGNTFAVKSPASAKPDPSGTAASSLTLKVEGLEISVPAIQWKKTTLAANSEPEVGNTPEHMSY